MAAAPADHARPRRRRRTVPAWAVPLVVIAVLGLAEVGARVVGPEVPREAGSEERAFVKADQIFARGDTDIVVLGSSDAAAGLIPSAILAESAPLATAYNAALVGTDLVLLHEWADRVVLAQLSPSVVVIAMQPNAVIDYADAPIDPSADTGPAYRAAFDQIDPGGLGSAGWQLRQHSALIRYRPYLRSPSLLADGVGNVLTGGAPDPRPIGDVEDGPTAMDWQAETDPRVVASLTAPDGEILEYRSPSPPVTGPEAATTAFTAASSFPVDLDPLAALVDRIRASGAEPVLALAPVDRLVLEQFGGDLSGLDELTQQLVAWGEERRVPVLDRFTEAWPADHFHDRQHLSRVGAERWSTDLGSFLAERCAAGDLGSACGP